MAKAVLRYSLYNVIQTNILTFHMYKMLIRCLAAEKKKVCFLCFHNKMSVFCQSSVIAKDDITLS